MTYKQLQTNFERELLFHLIFSMKKRKIDKKRAQQVAKEFIDILKKEEDTKGFMNSLSKKAEFYPEIRGAFLTVAKDFEKETVSENLERVRQALKGELN